MGVKGRVNSFVGVTLDLGVLDKSGVVALHSKEKGMGGADVRLEGEAERGGGGERERE